MWDKYPGGTFLAGYKDYDGPRGVYINSTASSICPFESPSSSLILQTPSVSFSSIMATSKSHSALTVDVPTGTALAVNGSTPTLFTPIKIRGLELHNRFVVSPMGMWSCLDGHLTDYHLVHLGAYAFRGAALTIVESTAVAPNGRSSPNDSGLWKDSQIAPLKRVVDFIHAQGQKVGIQFNHTGAKSSMLAPKLAPAGKPTIATEEEGGFPDDIWAPSAIPYTDAHPIPKALSVEGIEAIIKSFGDATRRAVEAGIGKILLFQD